MAIIWNADVSKTEDLLKVSGRRELRWFGITIGQVGFGVLVSRVRQPTKRAADGAICWACHKVTVAQNRDGWCEHCGSPRR